MGFVSFRGNSRCFAASVTETTCVPASRSHQSSPRCLFSNFCDITITNKIRFFCYFISILHFIFFQSNMRFAYFPTGSTNTQSRDITSHRQPQRAVTATAFSLGEVVLPFSALASLSSPNSPFLLYHIRVSGTAGCPALLHSPLTRYSLFTGSSNLHDQPQ